MSILQKYRINKDSVWSSNAPKFGEYEAFTFLATLEQLEIRIYKSTEPGNVLQASRLGETSRDYRIDTVGEKYITNFKTDKKPADYTVEIRRPTKNFAVGSFNFATTRK